MSAHDEPGIPLNSHSGRPAEKRGRLVVLLLLGGTALLLGVLLANPAQVTGQAQPTPTPPGGPNNLPDLPVWYCPSPTPWPSSTPCPTECVADPHWTPPATVVGQPTAEQPELCGDPDWCPNTPSPLPTATPYSRGACTGPGCQGNFFYLNQNVYAGDLRLTLKRSWSTSADYPGPTPHARNVYHYVDIELEWNGELSFTIWLPIQMTLEEIDSPDGALQGNWIPSEAAMRNLASNHGYPTTFDTEDPSANPYERPFAPGETRLLTVGFEGPVGTAAVVGITLDNSVVGDDVRILGGNNVRWWLRTDPVCAGNVEAPPDQGGGGTPVPWPPPGGCQLPVPAGSVVTRGYGCSGFYTGAISAECRSRDPNKPWFHAGYDFGISTGTPCYAVGAGISTALLDDDGADCPVATHPTYRHGYGYYVLLIVGNARIYYGHGDPGSGVDGEVESGDRVMDSDNTGCSSGDHLHFQINEAGVSVDPPLWIIEHCLP